MQPYDRFDPIPQPDVQEGSSETTWELWHDIKGKEHARYANTVPMTVPGERSPLSKDTRPPGAPLRPAASVGSSGLEKLVEESRRNNRVCPKAAKWAELDGALRNAAPSGSAAFLAPPLAEREWKTTTALAKRLMFRGVIDWAGKNGLVEPALQFVRALPEDQWHHMGD
jgi:hypothetical protein